jgi:hypothetical protein
MSGSGSGSDFLTSYGSGSGSTSQKVTVPTVPVPVPQHCHPLVLFDHLTSVHCCQADPGSRIKKQNSNKREGEKK